MLLGKLKKKKNSLTQIQETEYVQTGINVTVQNSLVNIFAEKFAVVYIEKLSNVCIICSPISPMVILLYQRLNK